MMVAFLKSIGNKFLAVASVVGLLALGWLRVSRSSERAGQDKVKAEAEEAAREYQNGGSEALIGGLENEAKVRNEKTDTNIVDHFNS